MKFKRFYERTGLRDSPACSDSSEGQYHVVLDFLQHVVVGHDQVFGCVSISDVGEDAQRLQDRHDCYGSSASFPLCH